MSSWHCNIVTELHTVFNIQ